MQSDGANSSGDEGSSTHRPRGISHVNCRACAYNSQQPRRKEKLTKTGKSAFFSATGRFSASPVGDGADAMYEDSPISSKYPSIAKQVEWDPVRNSCNSAFYSQSPRFPKLHGPGDWVPERIAPGTYNIDELNRAISPGDPRRPLSSFASCSPRFRKPSWEKPVTAANHDLGYYDPEREAAEWVAKGSAIPRAPRFMSRKFFPDESAEPRGTRRSKERPLDVREYSAESSLVKKTLAKAVETSPQRYSHVFRSAVKRFDPPPKKIARQGREVGPVTYASSYYRFIKAW